MAKEKFEGIGGEVFLVKIRRGKILAREID
jgi:hypothetical protein